VFTKVLVALDGSEPAAKSLDYALDIADKYSSEIVLLSVLHVDPRAYAPLVPMPEGELPISSVAMETYINNLKSSYEKVLSTALDKVKKTKPNLIVSTRLVEGRPANMIIEASKEGDIDLIVIGSRGLGGIREFLLGSVSDRVADEAQCPVLIIK
jgi:nucleotide-binding universal stress UspA family protein